MTMKAGYWVDLTGIEMSETPEGSGPQSWIQAMPLGTYEHPFYGKIDFTAKKVEQFVKNFNDNVRGTELDIDYDHKVDTGKAAGWVKAADARADGLYLLVEWTKAAAEAIKNKEYKYFSPEFADKWMNPKTKKVFSNVLFGGGITNRPFLKDILPVNMSETFGDQVFEGYKSSKNPIRQGGGKKMAKKFEELTLPEITALSEALGLGESASPTTVKAALEAMGSTPKQEPAPESEKLNEGGGNKKEQRLADGEVDQTLLADVAKLVGDNPALKVLAEVIENQSKELNTTTTALRFAEAQGKITKLNEVALQKRRAFPAVIEEDLREIIIDAPKAFGDKVFSMMQKLAATGMIQLGELGRTPGVGNATATFHDRVRQMQADNQGMSYAEACTAVAQANPALYDSYRNDITNVD